MAKGKTSKSLTQMDQAYPLYLLGTVSNTDIAKVVGVSPATIGKWASDENWDREREAMAAEDMAIVRNQIRKLMIEKRMSEISRQLDISGEIQENLKLTLRERNEKEVPTTAGSLRDFSIALKNASDVSLRLLGLTEATIASAAGETVEGGMVTVNVAVTGTAMPVAAGAQRNITDITKDVEVLGPGRAAGTDVTRDQVPVMPQTCPF